MATVHLGDCRDVLATIADNSIDSIVTDPPYELGFMGKAWDASGIAYDVTVWRHCLRVLKPGGHLIAFGGSRTYHRMAVAIEDAGFEIRDQIQWIYGSGFPKSLDVSKALDKQAGAAPKSPNAGKWKPGSSGAAPTHGTGWGTEPTTPHDWEPVTDAARTWDGWGTALKPAHEPAVLARKPLTGTVADNVTTWGVGAINVDGCRIGDGGQLKWSAPRGMGFSGGHYADNFEATKNLSGRWPANVIFDEEAAQVLDAQSGWSKSTVYTGGNRKSDEKFFKGKNGMNTAGHSDSGGASRFFYVAKASKAEREAGLDNADGRANHHPTVKPIALMRYLVRMVTPKGGIVLDPFTGSGSTGCAAVLEGCDFVGMDITPEYVEIAQKRIAYYAVESPLLL